MGAQDPGGPIEVKAANVADLAVTVEPTTDPHEFDIIGSVTGVQDEVKDIIEPGAYDDTLRRRRPKIIKDHDWAHRLGRVLDIKELKPGDPGLPKTTAQGNPWPSHAGALVSRVRLFQSQEGKDAAERWREYGQDQQFSIGYRVPPGGATKDSRGVRHIKTLDLYEISDVLWGAMPLAGPMPSALATKTAAAIEHGEAEVDDVDPTEDPYDWDVLTSLDDDETVEVIEASGATPDAVDALGDTVADEFDADEAKMSAAELEVKYDTSPIGTPGGKENWVDKVGGLPLYIRAIAHALIREGFTKERAIATAVNRVKKWAAGVGNVSAKTRAKAAKAVAEWEAKKARAGVGTKAFTPFTKAPKSKNKMPVTVGAEVTTPDGTTGKVTKVEGAIATVNGKTYPAGSLTRTDDGKPPWMKGKDAAPDVIEVKDDGVVLDGVAIAWDEIKSIADGAFTAADQDPPAGTSPVDTDQAGTGGLGDAADEIATGHAERKDLDLPYFAGSWQERMALMRKALDESVEAEEFDGPATIAAAYDDSFLATVGEGDDRTAYRVEYRVTDDGVLTLGAVEEVALIVGDSADPDGDPDDVLDADAEAVAADVEMTVKAIGSVMQTKVGRVVSGRNANRLRQALASLVEMLKAAGIDVTEVVSPTAKTAPPAADPDAQAAAPVDGEAPVAAEAKGSPDFAVIAAAAAARRRRLEMDAEL